MRRTTMKTTTTMGMMMTMRMRRPTIRMMNPLPSQPLRRRRRRRVMKGRARMRHMPDSWTAP